MIRVSQRAEVRQMFYVDGVPKKQIARRSGRDIKTVRPALERDGVPARPESPAPGPSCRSRPSRSPSRFIEQAGLGKPLRHQLIEPRILRAPLGVGLLRARPHRLNRTSPQRVHLRSPQGLRDGVGVSDTTPGSVREIPILHLSQGPQPAAQ